MCFYGACIMCSYRYTLVKSSSGVALKPQLRSRDDVRLMIDIVDISLRGGDQHITDKHKQ